MGVKDASERSSAVQAVIRSWAEDDASAAEKWVATLPGGQLQDSATVALAIAVAGSDFEHAVGLAQLVPERVWNNWEENGSYLEALYENAIADDPAHALAVTAKLGRNPTLTEAAMEMVGKKWAAGNLDGAAKWMQSLSETELQKNGSAINPILQAWLEKNAVSATAAAPLLSARSRGKK